MRNFAEDEADEGTIWFSENDAEEVVLSQLDRLAREGPLTKRTARFLDLGTGNGHMLFALRECGDDFEEGSDDDDENDDNGKDATQMGVHISNSASASETVHGWTGEFIGVDYSHPSVALAQRIAASRNAEDILFEQWDLLSEEPGTWIRDGFDVVLDKGTFDAISLMPRDTAHAAADVSRDHPCNVYRQRVAALVKKGAFLVITSCNWTRDELVAWIEGGTDHGPRELSFYAEAKYPTFTFGGKTGQSIVTVVFQKTK